MNVMTPEQREEYAHKQVARIGNKPGNPPHEEMLDMGRRGWPAWRIAQAYDLSPALIYELGDPRPPTPKNQKGE